MKTTLDKVEQDHVLNGLVDKLLNHGIPVHSYSNEVGIILDRSGDSEPVIIPATFPAVAQTIKMHVARTVRSTITYLDGGVDND